MDKQPGQERTTSLVDVFIIAGLVLAFRVLMESALPFFQDHFNLNFNDTLMEMLRNYPLALMMIVLDFLLVWLLQRFFYAEGQSALRTVVELAGLVAIAFGSAFMLRAMQSVGQVDEVFFNHIFWYTVLTAFIFNAVIISVMSLVAYYGRRQKKALDVEVGKKNKARYQYQQLKRQLNPHFLFNSLNSLDYLIHTDADKASDYVRKLAALYRYLLSIGDETQVMLSEEVAFVKLYVELLTQRFDTGLLCEWDIKEEDLRKKMIPCGLQLLMENATKHNVISKAKPLCIKIATDGEYVTVTNNFQPKIYKVESTGLGLNNIRGQYLSVFGKDIVIEQTTREYVVKLPLIE